MPRIRGLLPADYQRLRRRVVAGLTTWEAAAAAGLCDSKAKTGPKPKPLGKPETKTKQTKTGSVASEPAKV